MNVTAQARSAGRRADQSDWMDHAVRVGIVSYGVVHLVLAWLTLKPVTLAGMFATMVATPVIGQVYKHFTPGTVWTVTMIQMQPRMDRIGVTG